MTRRRITRTLAIAGLLGLLPCAAMGDTQPSPAPNASPLKTIIEVRSSLLCQTLHQAVQPTLAGIMKNDSLLDAANRAFAKMFADQAAGANGSTDRLFLRNVAGALSHNLSTISQILGHGFPQDENATTHAYEELIKARLQAVASAQNDALNLIEGYVTTEDMGRARDEFPGGHQSGANEVEGPSQDSQGFQAGFHNANDPATPYTDMAGLQGTQHGVDGKSPQSSPVALLGLTRTRISGLEEPAGSAVMIAVQVCNSK